MRRFLLVLALLVAMGAGILTQVVPAHAAPLNAVCYSTGCDDYSPPPINSCNGVQTAAKTTPLKDADGTEEAVLYLYYSNGNGCQSVWAAVDTINTVALKITAIGIWENDTCCGSDGSNIGALDRLPITRTDGQWESTYMIGVDGPYGYQASVDWTDQYNVTHGPINSGWYYPL